MVTGLAPFVRSAHTLFPLELLPDWLAGLALWNPATYTILMVREMMTGVPSGVPVALSLGVLSVFVVVVILVAGWVFTRDVNRPF